MATAEEILSNLRGDKIHVSRLVTLAFDDLLSRSVGDLIEPSLLTKRIVDGFVGTAKDPNLEQWLNDRITEALAQIEGGKTLRGTISEEVVESARSLVGREFHPNRDVLMAIMDHDAVRSIMRDVLMSTLSDFGQSLKIPPPSPTTDRGGSRFGRLSGFVAQAQGVAANVGSIVERQLEGKITSFVDGAIGNVIESTVDNMVANESVEALAKWRIDMLEQALDTTGEKLKEEVERHDTKAMVSELTLLLRSLAGWDGLTPAILSVLEKVSDEHRSASDFLNGTTLESEWRPQLEEVAVERACEFVLTEPFGAWLTELVDGSGS